MYIDTHFFLDNSVPTNAMHVVYNYYLIILSYFIAILSSFVALEFVGHLLSETNCRRKKYWTIGGSTVMGVGIWSMHFIGILALELPIPINFDFLWTLASLLVAIIASGIALFLIRNVQRSLWHLIIGGIILGAGIASMLYIGLEGIETNIDVVYIPKLVILSIVIAIFAAELALCLALRSNTGHIEKQLRLKILSALIMATAMCGMNSTGVAAAIFIPRSSSISGSLILIQNHDLALYASFITCLIMIMALIILTYRQLIVNIMLRKREMNYTAALISEKNLLEDRVVERTKELQAKNKSLVTAFEDNKSMQQQLIQSEKMATVGQLAAGIAHEINNPLSYVISNMNILAKRLTKDNEEKNNTVKDDTMAILAETDAGLLRIKNIVANLRIFSGSSQESMQKGNINACIESAINLAWSQLKHKCVIYKNFMDLPECNFHPQQMEMVFINLLLNAAQAIAEQGEITISTTANNHAIKIVVADTGQGIPPENLKKIFTPFFSTKPVGSSVGMGLAISYGIIELHGGTITVKSVVGKGTVFTISIPIK